MSKLEKILLALSTLVAMSMNINAHAEDRFVTCQRFGRMQDCIAVPLADKSDDSEAKQFQAPTDAKSRIYIVRPLTQEQKKKSRVFLDGQLVAEIAPMTYVTVDVIPGPHHITLNTSEDTEIQLDVAPGKLYYVEYHFNLWLNTITAELTLLNEKDGQSQVLKSKKVRPTIDIH